MNKEHTQTENLFRSILTEVGMICVNNDDDSLKALAPMLLVKYFQLGNSSRITPYGNFADVIDLLRWEHERQKLITYDKIIRQRFYPVIPGYVVAILTSSTLKNWGVKLM